ncbi:MAG: hypothetical protein LQ344_006429 [Seirophora lacunosa]|nr:MAG: hypothetical protein LQ344_006429 [Seirophora lacunosa]
MAATTEDLYAVSPLTSVCTPDSFSMHSSCFSSCQSPETADPSDLWTSPFNFGNLNDQQISSEDFGLGLETLDEADQCLYPSLGTNFEPLHFDPGSPDGQSWSSLSDTSGGPPSEMADVSPQTSLDPGLAADLDAFLCNAGSTPSLPQYTTTPNNSSHYRAESAPRHSFRTSPYPMNLGRGRSASTGSVALARTQRASTYFQDVQQTPDLVSQLSSPSDTNTVATFEDNEFQVYCQSNQSYVARTHHIYEEQIHALAETADILQSSSHDNHFCEHHFAGSTSPPDLFGPLSQEPSSPPPEDFDCEESMMPRMQDLRFAGDMYTPRYVRGHGNKREGWCGTCKPGRWLVLKNSAFWYDKSFSHGISAATGSPFEGPRETRRMKGNPDVWEGLCGSCGDWIALISSKKKGTTWFRHAYKCHTHQKVKDMTKRRREVALGRTGKMSKAGSIKSESREETPFSTESGLTPLHEVDTMEDNSQNAAGS